MSEDVFHLGVKAIIQNTDGKILLLKVNLKKLKAFNGEAYWDIPGGRVKQGDSVEMTLLREVAEETGITSLQSFRPFSMVLSPMRIPVGEGSVGLVLAAYVCEIPETQPIILSDEHTEYGWFEPPVAADLLKVKYPVEFVDRIRAL